MKKLVATLLSVCMLAGLMAGCGGLTASTDVESAVSSEKAISVTDEEAEIKQSAPAEETASVEAEAALEEQASVEEAASGKEKKVIEYPVSDGETLSIFCVTPSRVDSVTDIISFGEAEKITGVNIDWVEVSFMAVTENTNLMVASGNYTDMIVAMNAAATGNALSSMITLDEALKQNILADLTDYLPEYAPDYYSMIADDSELMNQITTMEGRIATFFQIYDSIVAIRGDIIRQDWLDDLGMEVPQTYDQLHETLLAFKAKYDCEYPYLMNQTTCDFYQLTAGYDIPGYTCGSNNLGLYVIDGQVYSTLNSDGYREYIDMLATWYQEKLFSANFTNIVNGFMDGTREQLLVTDQVGVQYVSNNGSVGYAAEALDPDFAMSPLPNITKEEGQQVHFIEDYSKLNTAVNIFAACENIELACEYLNYFYTEEGSLLATYGVEGIDWEYGKDGLPEFIDKVMQHESLSPNMAAQTVTMSSAWIGKYPERIKTYFYTDQQFTNNQIWMSNADSEYMLIGVTSPLSDNVEEYNAMVSDITTYADTMVLSFIIGNTSMDEWDSFQKQLEALGINECVEMMQEAYDYRYNR